MFFILAYLILVQLKISACLISSWCISFHLILVYIATQGYVAHNDEVVVLSYRCTTSTFDWLTNFQTTSSAWEPEVDIPHGYSGVCSDFEGLACCGWFGGLAGGMARNTGKARVHTGTCSARAKTELVLSRAQQANLHYENFAGFYNNFLATVPDIQQYVEPLLGPDQPPRTLYVVGHSLGAGVATLASCYFLLEHDWSKLPQSFRSVTAGSPRACGSLMAEDVEKRIAELALDPSSDVKVYRLVNGTDVVASVPPRQFGFKHVAGAVKINGDDGTIEMPAMKDRSAAGAGDGGSEENESSKDVSEGELNEIVHDSEKVRGEAAPAAEGRASQTDYEKLVSKVPKPLRDHMPDFYLRPIMRARGITLPQMAFGGGGS